MRIEKIELTYSTPIVDQGRIKDKINEIIDWINNFERKITGISDEKYYKSQIAQLLTNAIAENTGPKRRGVFHD